MKRKYLLTGLVALLSYSYAIADISNPGVATCEVTKVTPEGANFFGFKKGPVVGDTTVVDLAASEIENFRFSSGAFIGPTVHKHNLVKQQTWNGMSLWEVHFKSLSNGNDYTAVFIAHDTQDEKIAASLDVLEKQIMGRLTLESLELNCKR